MFPYNNAVKELMKKGYLVNTCGNNYQFNEKPQKNGRHRAEEPQPAAGKPVEGETVKALLDETSRNNA